MTLLPANIISSAKKPLKKTVLPKLYVFFEKLGVHILPVHFYSGLPEYSYLSKHKEQWMRRSELPGIKIDLDQQVSNMIEICLPFQEEFLGLSIFREAVKKNGEPGYGEIESQSLHGFARFFKPRRVMQVGCGVSTHCLRHAVGLNGTPTAITCIEPFPNKGLKSAEDISLIPKPVQAVSADYFSQLSENDFLFIDSTHVVQVGSDVNYLILEVLPRLAPGVIVHFHDIYFPYDYPRRFLQTVLFPLETSLLRAFLINNPKAEIIACMSQLHYDRPEALQTIFPDYNPRQNNEGLAGATGAGEHFPSSIWFRIKE